MTTVADNNSNLEVRLGNVEARLDGVEVRLGSVESQLANLTERIATLEGRVNEISQMLSNLHTGQRQIFFAILALAGIVVTGMAAVVAALVALVVNII